MPEHKAPHPTNAELAILTVLWRRGPSTVRDVHGALCEPVGYTTILKLLQIMTDKGLVTRDESARTHVYRATLSETTTQGELVSDLIDRAFGGSPVALIVQALSATPASSEEIDEIRRLLDERKGDT